ncbi:ABC transporter substrate-binding protein [Micropruina sonneratiae]|uniref:ABC transporter substrate-binding protein n=1 Tax=Micropruina sonneratiae TaxID=2986940 RepID=UPI002226E60D|nr:extracellular solute-binding protein [Micropruina sp. KQZ13P-5]MCW3159113.1 extracellular solute-binding protein [Micropruina sp. KQZ13P-5]
MATTMLRGRRAPLATGLITLATVGALTLAGCSGGAPASSASVPTEASQVTGELNILVSSASGSDAGFKAVNDAFAKQYPEVKLNFTAVPNENYNQARASRLSAGTIDVGLANPKQLPDYVPESNKGDDARLADAGGFMDLTDQPFMKKFQPSVLEKITYNGRNYTVPTGLSYYTGLTYNKKIFADNNITVPTTWDEFIKVCDTLKAKGITPISIGGKDTAGIVMLSVVQSLYPTAQAKQDLAKGLYEHTVALNEGTQLEVLTKVQQLYGYGQANFAGSNYNQMTSEFLTGKAAMISDGTWNVGSLNEADKVDFGYFPLPASNNAADNAYLGGKVELSLAVPTNAKNPTAALAWLSFFADNYKLFNDKAGFAPSQEGVEGDPFYTEIAPYTKNFEPAWDTIWIANTSAGQAAALPFNWNAVKPMGSMDAQGAAGAAQKDWDAAK